MLSMHTNSATLAAQNAIDRTQRRVAASMTRLGTGYRVNSAMDDAAGLQIATRLKAQTSGMKVAMRNIQNSTSMLQVAEGALDEATTMLVRMKDLATQAADASATLQDQQAMQAEYDALGEEVWEVLNQTKYGGRMLLVGAHFAVPGTRFQIGAEASETMVINLLPQLGLGNTLDAAVAATSARYASMPMFPVDGNELSTVAGAAIGLLNTAVDEVSSLRSTLGALANRLEHAYNNLANMTANTEAAEGRVMDADYATESSTMTAGQMLMQSGTAMLKQTNSMASMIVSLLQ